MKKVLRGIFVVAFMASFAHAGYNREPGYRVDNKHTDRGVQIANELLRLRKDLAQKHVIPKAKVTEDAAQKICIAVAEGAKKIATENNIFVIRFVSEKYRNPASAPEDSRWRNELKGLETLDRNRNKKEYWTSAKINDEKFYMYMKPIFAEKSCLACHGEAKKRPKFIKQKYPEDRSYGFEVGDFMGAVAVYTLKGF